MFHFEATETPGTLNFIQHFTRDFLLIQVSGTNTLFTELYSNLANKGDVGYITRMLEAAE